jgi:hypothetical protein
LGSSLPLRENKSGNSEGKEEWKYMICSLELHFINLFLYDVLFQRQWSQQAPLDIILIFIVFCFTHSLARVRHVLGCFCRAVFLNRLAAARYRALASIIPGREW